MWPPDGHRYISVATHVGCSVQRRSFWKQRTVNPPIAPARYNFLYSSSRPALRAAVSGGRPRAGSDATVTVGAQPHQRAQDEHLQMMLA
jgi:hypothetical protein